MWWPFAFAALLYLLFRLWYDGIRGPLTPSEIAEGLAAIQARDESRGTDTEAFRRFLEADDGREFLMLNLVRVASGTVAHPETGAQVPARDMLNHYSRHFLKRLFRRGGHPAIAARKIGPYVDAWGDVQADPSWSIMGYMRYRSRRDLLMLASDPSFGPIHAYKSLGTDMTFSFPTQPFMMLYLSPRWWVAFLLLLLAALTTMVLG